MAQNSCGYWASSAAANPPERRRPQGACSTMFPWSSLCRWICFWSHIWAMSSSQWTLVRSRCFFGRKPPNMHAA